jgi:hypothetical protein
LLTLNIKAVTAPIFNSDKKILSCTGAPCIYVLTDESSLAGLKSIRDFLEANSFEEASFEEGSFKPKFLVTSSGSISSDKKV